MKIITQTVGGNFVNEPEQRVATLKSLMEYLLETDLAKKCTVRGRNPEVIMTGIKQGTVEFVNTYVGQEHEINHLHHLINAYAAAHLACTGTAPDQEIDPYQPATTMAYVPNAAAVDLYRSGEISIAMVTMLTMVNHPEFLNEFKGFKMESIIGLYVILNLDIPENFRVDWLDQMFPKSTTGETTP